MKCPKCSGEMEEGFVKGFGDSNVRNKWGKDGLNWRGRVKNGKDIIVYRCKSCGYLEDYAK